MSLKVNTRLFYIHDVLGRMLGYGFEGVLSSLISIHAAQGAGISRCIPVRPAAANSLVPVVEVYPPVFNGRVPAAPAGLTRLHRSPRVERLPLVPGGAPRKMVIHDTSIAKDNTIHIQYSYISQYTAIIAYSLC